MLLELVDLAVGDSVYFYHPETSDDISGKVGKVVKRCDTEGNIRRLYTIVVDSEFISPSISKHIVITDDYLIEASDLL